MLSRKIETSAAAQILSHWRTPAIIHTHMHARTHWCEKEQCSLLVLLLQRKAQGHEAFVDFFFLLLLQAGSSLPPFTLLSIQSTTMPSHSHLRILDKGMVLHLRPWLLLQILEHCLRLLTHHLVARWTLGPVRVIAISLKKSMHASLAHGVIGISTDGPPLPFRIFYP